jgi:hypothetical protein
MKTERQQTRDRREDRCEREEKFSDPMDTLPGKTLRDRTPAVRGKLERSTRPRGGTERFGKVELAVVSRLPLTPAPVLAESHTASFGLHAPHAASVLLAGTFNDWSPGATPLSKGSEGVWEIQMPLKPGAYQYKFIVDGVWQEDPLACDSVENPFGSRNSVKHVG